MALKPSKKKPFTLFLILFFTIFITLNSLYQIRWQHQEDQNALTYPQPTMNLNWFKFIARELGDKSINIALVNVDETRTMDMIPTKGKIIKVDFDRVASSVTWSNLYPHWINETTDKCPNVPMPTFEKYEQLDVVVAMVPSDRIGLRDVYRLQVNLVVANLLVRCGRVQHGVNRPVFAVFIGSSGPMWEIFRCDDLVLHGDNYLIYKPQLRRLRPIILMPVGSCQLDPPLARLNKPREAYATILHSSEKYVCGAIALAQSIIQLNTTKDLVLLVDDHISHESMDGLRSAGWKIKRIQRIRNPHSKKDSYNEWNYSKLRLWQLIEYEKVMFIDADFIVVRSLDEFFTSPGISAKRNDKHLFNSGLMLLEPSMCTFRTLMEMRWLVRSYNGGDQGYLNEMFPWWHRLPNKINHFKLYQPKNVHTVPKDIYAIHYFGMKPWWCYRDYDCNWDIPQTQMYADDYANKFWWDVYDKMSQNLRISCPLTLEMHAINTANRNKARDANFTDGHWRIKITDPRLKNIL